MRVLLLCACVAAALAAPTDPWGTFKLTYNKVYMPEEEEFRQQTFLKTLEFIQQHNKEADEGLHTYRVGLNEFSDWTDEEYRKLLLAPEYQPPVIPDMKVEPYNGEPIPAAFDWRTRGGVTPVKNQGSCGSCWAFASVGSLEGNCFRKDGKLNTLSEQQLLDCSRRWGNNGCSGGYSYKSFEYVRDVGGVVLDSCYKYNGRENTCRFDSVKHCIACKCSGYQSPRGEDRMAQVIGNTCPIAVSIDASRNGFRNYKSGVYRDDPCQKYRSNHLVLAVGYGSGFWDVKNSWGTGWGNRGYIRFHRGSNTCGIGSYPSIPT